MNWDTLEIDLREWKKDQLGSRSLRRWRRTVRKGAQLRQLQGDTKSAGIWRRAARNG